MTLKTSEQLQQLAFVDGGAVARGSRTLQQLQDSREVAHRTDELEHFLVTQHLGPEQIQDVATQRFGPDADSVLTALLDAAKAEQTTFPYEEPA